MLDVAVDHLGTQGGIQDVHLHEAKHKASVLCCQSLQTLHLQIIVACNCQSDFIAKPTMLLLTTYFELCQALWHDDKSVSVKSGLYFLLSRKHVGC